MISGKLLSAALACILTVNVSFADAILQDTSGNKTSFAQLKGKWVFINYWAEWCESCLNEIPELNRFYKKHKKSAALFAVNYDAPPLKEQLILMQDLHIKYPNLIQDPSESLGIGDIRGVPVTFVFNPEGVLVILCMVGNL